mmetsp:Transcript_19308/g.24913  ORF Transcript_19308/g.24913 Transcript_19308/m.24913 type:complete len:122 (+) Transcript_19308:260-625(+)
MNALRNGLLVPFSRLLQAQSPWASQQPQQLMQQTRNMSKYLSKSATKRQPLTTKRATKGGYYKGKGHTKEGRINSKAKFIVDPRRRLELVIPDLTGFKLKPYIAATASKFPPEERRIGPQS